MSDNVCTRKMCSTWARSSRERWSRLCFVVSAAVAGGVAARRGIGYVGHAHQRAEPRIVIRGLAAVDPDGAFVGKVRAVQNFGAGDLLEVEPEGGGATFLVPFTKGFVPEVDVAGRRVTIALPASESSSRTREPSPLVGEGGERTKSANRVRGSHSAQPLTRSSPSARTALSRKGRG